MRISTAQSKWGKVRSLSGVSFVALLSVCATAAPKRIPQDAGQLAIQQTEPTERKDAWRFVPQEFRAEPTNAYEEELLKMRGSDEGNPNLAPLDQARLDKSEPSLDPILHFETGNKGEGSSRGAWDKIPFPEGQAIVVANFSNFKVFLTPSHRSIYTVVRLEVEQVLDPGEQGVSAGQAIDLIMRGGTLLLSDGRVVTYGIDSKDANYCIQPGHTYLLLLNFDQDSKAFRMTESVYWELANGLAVPTQSDDGVRVGQIALAGLPEERFLRLIRQAVEQHTEQTNRK